MKQTFENMNSSYMSYIERFRSAVDDRGKYETEIELYNIHKENIMAISECTKGFMDRWNSVISGLVEDEENKEIEKNLL